MATNPDQIDDQMLLFSQFCSDHYTNPPNGESRGRRRRKKSKGEGSGLELKKRRLSAAQVIFLERNFGDEHKLESGRKARLATELGLDPKQVAVWFQNRRARWKSKKLEEEFVGLKKKHEEVIVEKYQLEEEVLKLKEQLSVAEKEITKLSERLEGVSVGERSCSPSSSFSMDAHQQPFLGDYSVQEDAADFLYSPEYNCINGMEWANFHALW